MLQLGLHRGKRRKKMQKLGKVLAVSLLNVLKVYQNGLIVWKLKLVCVIVGALCQQNFPHARGVFSGKNLNWDWPCVNRNKKRFFFLFIAETIIFRTKVSCKCIFSGNILSRGFLRELENYGNSRGWVGRGVWQAPPRMEIPGGWGV